MGTQKESLKMAIKDEFMSCFRKANAKSGDTLSTDWLYSDFLPSLSDKEHLALEEIINEMITDGIINLIGGRKVTYSLTQKGEDML